MSVTLYLDAGTLLFLGDVPITSADLPLPVQLTSVYISYIPCNNATLLSVSCGAVDTFTVVPFNARIPGVAGQSPPVNVSLVIQCDQLICPAGHQYVSEAGTTVSSASTAAGVYLTV